MTTLPLPDQLRAQREAQRLKQWQVAERADMAANRYQDYESGRKSLTVTTLTRIAAALGCEIVLRLKEDGK
jgi:transcriptional regulator with XRE-family HTH domain